MALINLNDDNDQGHGDGPTDQLSPSQVAAMLAAQASGGGMTSNPSLALLQPQNYGPAYAGVLNAPMPPQRPPGLGMAAGSGVQAFHRNMASPTPTPPAAPPPQATPAPPPSANQMLGQGSQMNPLQIFLSQLGLGQQHGRPNYPSQNPGLLGKIAAVPSELGGIFGGLFGGNNGQSQAASPTLDSSDLSGNFMNNNIGVDDAFDD